jgi:hypothetical protein
MKKTFQNPLKTNPAYGHKLRFMAMLEDYPLYQLTFKQWRWIMGRRAGEIEISKLKNGQRMLQRHAERLVELRDLKKDLEIEIKETTELVVPLMLKVKEGTVIFPRFKLELYEDVPSTSFDKKKMEGVLAAKGWTKAEIAHLMEVCTTTTVKAPFVKIV